MKDGTRKNRYNREEDVDAREEVGTLRPRPSSGLKTMIFKARRSARWCCEACDSISLPNTAH